VAMAEPPARLTVSLLVDAAGIDQDLSPEQMEEALAGISVLRLDWRSIGRIENLELCPALEDLYLQHNLIRRIENLEFLKQLTFLALSGNLITELAGLESLASLKLLDLSDNKIERLDEDSLPLGLVILKLHGNPCTGEDFYRQRLITALPRLKQLDGVRISSMERRVLGAPLESDDEEDGSGEEVSGDSGGEGDGGEREERKKELARASGGMDEELGSVMAQLRQELERVTAGGVEDSELAEAPRRRRELRGTATMRALEQSQHLSRLAAQMADKWMEDAQAELHAKREAAFARARSRLEALEQEAQERRGKVKEEVAAATAARRRQREAESGAEAKS